MVSSRIIYKYFPKVSETQKNQVDMLYPLYWEWNSKVNVISRKDLDQLYERHVLHSLSIAKFIDFQSGSNILDVGTGGGFPGIPLAIMFPTCHFHLVDSIGKKMTVVREIINALQLKNLTVDHQRMEKVKGTFDFVISRAVGPTKQLFRRTHQKVSKEQYNNIDNGMILLKGGNLTLEMKELGRKYVSKNLSDFFDERFFDTKKIIYIAL